MDTIDLEDFDPISSYETIKPIVKKIDFKELVQIFLNSSIKDIKSETETPNINFKFEEDGFELFKSIVENPYVKNDYWVPPAEEKDIEFLRYHNDDDVPTIYINDSIRFFEYLTNITNSQIELNTEYGINLDPRGVAINILKRIWLRMGIEDIENIDNFLNKQLQFLTNRLLDTHNPEKIGLLDDYEILMNSKLNATYDETTRSMIFTIQNNENSYELPHILYDIDDNGICYIYAIQSSKSNKDKKIERRLYKLNKNIENPNVHPSKVYALLLFINELKKKGITKIRIPSIQILSYRYHELLSEKARINLEKAKMEYESNPNEEYFKEKYEAAKEWYNSSYEKQDIINYLKTEELMNIAHRILKHDESIEIVEELNDQKDYLGMQIK